MFHQVEKEIDYVEIEMPELDRMVKECRTLIEDFKKNKEEFEAKERYSRAKKQVEGRIPELIRPFDLKLKEFLEAGALTPQTYKYCYDLMFASIADSLAKTNATSQDIIRQQIGKCIHQGGTFTQFAQSLRQKSCLSLSNCSVTFNRIPEDLKLFINMLNTVGKSPITFTLTTLPDFNTYQTRLFNPTPISPIPPIPPKAQLLLVFTQSILHATFNLHIKATKTTRYLYECCGPINQTQREFVLNLSERSERREYYDVMFYLWRVYEEGRVPTLQGDVRRDYRVFMENLLRAFVPLKEKKDYYCAITILKKKETVEDQKLYMKLERPN